MKICIHCGLELPLSEFYNKFNKCKSCSKIYAIAWQKANPDKVKQQRKRSNKKRWERDKNNPEYKLKKKLYRQQTSAVRTERAKIWNKNNKEKFYRHVYKSQMSKKVSKKGGSSYLILDKEIDRIYSMPCFFCGTTENITIDHIIPISRSGNHSIGNLQPLCRSCNSKKMKKFNSEYKYKTLKKT